MLQGGVLPLLAHARGYPATFPLQGQEGGWEGEFRVGPGCGEAMGTALIPGCPRFPSGTKGDSVSLSLKRQRSHKAGFIPTVKTPWFYKTFKAVLGSTMLHYLCCHLGFVPQLSLPLAF